MRSLHDSLDLAGFEVIDLEVLPHFKASLLDSAARAPRTFWNREVVPETLAWSARAVRRRLDELDPTLVVCITSRCFHPLLLGPWETYIDYVDRLSVSYADRAGIAHHLLKRLQYRLLSVPQRRFESARPAGVTGAFAAGQADATALGVACVPITATPDPRPLDLLRPTDAAMADLGFVGTLDYPPNVDAVLALAQMWPQLAARRPGLSAIIAGARPTRDVRDAVQRHGWTLLPNFESVDEVFLQTRIAVAPLRHASGIQIKALDAAAHAVPQIVSPVVAQGLDPRFPLVVADGLQEWVEAVADLLEDPDHARDLGERSRRHLGERYSDEAVAESLRALLDPMFAL